MSNCFRHDGSTGIMAVADKDKKVIITLLTNRGHPDVNNNRVEAYKSKIADTIMTILGYWFNFILFAEIIYKIDFMWKYNQLSTINIIN